MFGLSQRYTAVRCCADSSTRRFSQRSGLFFAAAFAVFALLSTVAAPAAALDILSSKFAPDVRARLQADSDLVHRSPAAPPQYDVIVKYDSPNSAKRALSSATARLGTQGQTDVRSTAVPSLDSLTNSSLVVTRGTADTLIALAADSHVMHISLDRSTAICADYALEAVGAGVAQTNFGLTGRGITVAVLDSGIAPSKDLTIMGNESASRVVGWVDFVNGRLQPYDDNGHGTHVAGIVGGNGATALQNRYNTSFARVAPEVRLVGVKVLDSDGAGTTSRVIAGIEWCIAHKADYGIRVLNLSLGQPVAESYTTDPLCQACERAWKAGLVVVVSAGNNGRSVPEDSASPTLLGSITAPGNDPYVITVGASKTLDTLSVADDAVSSFSSRGPTAFDYVAKPDLVAPGNRIASLAVGGSPLAQIMANNLIDPLSYGGSGGRTYLQLSGTSMASPMVAGTAALLLQADPTLTPDAIKSRLMATATKLNGETFLDEGAGAINIVAALQATLPATPLALSPSVATSSDFVISVSNLVWGEMVLWGDTVDKKSPKFADSPTWGNESMWGANSPWSEMVLWGDTVDKQPTGKSFMFGD